MRVPLRQPLAVRLARVTRLGRLAVLAAPARLRPPVRTADRLHSGRLLAAQAAEPSSPRRRTRLVVQAGPLEATHTARHWQAGRPERRAAARVAQERAWRLIHRTADRAEAAVDRCTAAREALAVPAAYTAAEVAAAEQDQLAVRVVRAQAELFWLQHT